MAATGVRQGTETEPKVGAPASTSSTSTSSTPTRSSVDLSPPKLDWRLLGTVIVTAIAASAVIEWLTPPPVHPEEHIDALSMLVNGAFFGFLFAGACMLTQRRAALGYSFIAVAAWAQFVGVLACPLSGHHDFGAWWAGQMAVCLAFAVVSTVAAFISRAGGGVTRPDAAPAHRSRA
jgi:hypothetical protein